MYEDGEHKNIERRQSERRTQRITIACSIHRWQSAAKYTILATACNVFVDDNDDDDKIDTCTLTHSLWNENRSEKEIGRRGRGETVAAGCTWIESESVARGKERNRILIYRERRKTDMNEQKNGAKICRRISTFGATLIFHLSECVTNNYQPMVVQSDSFQMSALVFLLSHLFQ